MIQGSVEVIRNFHSDALNRDDRVFRVYLPPHYDESTDRYPVIYMHDGQWVFGCEGQSLHTGGKADGGMMDVITDEMIVSGEIPPVILVAVDCDVENRRQEMSHSTPPKARRMGRRGYIPCFAFEGEGLGFQYQTHVADEVKPYVDAHYRTQPEREHTMITGSSMGGLVSLRMGMYRQEVFGLLGLQSPAVHWESDDFYNHAVKNYGQKIWLDCGSAEAYYVDNTRFLVKLFNGLGYKYNEDFVYYLQPDATHCGAYFAPRYRQMLLWFFGKKSPVTYCEIVARDDVAVVGHVTVLNTLVHYQNGLVISDMDARYTIEPAEGLSVAPTGEVTAHNAGEAVICYVNGGITAEKQVTILNALSEDVLIYVTVTVPDNTPQDGPIVYHFFRDQFFILERGSDGKYRGFIGVPRDWRFDGHFTRCAENRDRKRECTATGEQVDRRVIAEETLHLEYTVEAWLE